MPLNNSLLLSIIVPIIGGLLGFGIYHFAYVSDYLPMANMSQSNAHSSPPLSTTDAVSGARETSSQTAPGNINDTSSTGESNVLTPRTITDVFGGRMVKRVGSESMNGKSARQYEFQVDSEFVSDDELQGDAHGLVIISIQNEYDGEINPNNLKLWAYYNPQKDWYEIIRAVAVFVDYEYAADFSDNRILVGAAHNVFVGRVVRQIGVVETASSPETKFAVEVVENIKGNLQGIITVHQAGMYLGGISYVPSGGERSDYILEPGSTYLLVTRYNETEDWHKLNPYPTASKLLSSDPDASVEQLKAHASIDSRVSELKVAYPNEILLEADVQSGKTYNDYQNRKPLPSSVNESF